MDTLQRDRLLKFGAVPFTTDVIAGEFGDYSAVLAKIASLVDEGSLVRIKRGLYCLSPNTFVPILTIVLPNRRA